MVILQSKEMRYSIEGHMKASKRNDYRLYKEKTLCKA